MGKYTVMEWITFFYVYGFLGWVWESCYVSVRQGKWVNRGFLRGPLLPIYGYGAVMMLAVSEPFAGNYVLTWIAGVIGATALEYVTGWAMEKLFKVRYWDYSKQPFNIRGYICLSSSVAWGFFTILMTEVLHPPVERIVNGTIAIDVHGVIFAVVSVVFAADTITSVKAAFDMAHALEALGKIRNELENIQVQMALLKKETSDYMETNLGGVLDRVEELKLYAMNMKEESSERTAAVKESILRKLEKLKELDVRRTELASHKEKIVKGMNFIQKGLLRGNPTANAGKLEKSFKELKDKFIKQE